jgi:hypothetical protein
MDMQTLEGRARPAPQDGDLVRGNTFNHKLGLSWRQGSIKCTWQGQDLLWLLVKGDIFMLFTQCILLGVSVYLDFQLRDFSGS